MRALPQKPQTILDTLKTGIIANKNTFFKILPMTFLIFLLYVIKVQTLAFMLGQNALVQILAGVLYYVAFFIVNAAFYYRIVSLVLENKNLNLLSLLNIGLKRALPLFGTSLVFGLIGLPGIIVLVLAYKFVHDPAALSIIVAMAMLYLMYVYVKLIFSLFFASIPDKRVFESINESAKLVSGHFFRTIFLIFLSVLLIFILYVCLAGIYLAFTGGIEHFKQQTLTLLYYYSSPFFSQIFMVFLAVILNDLQQRKHSRKTK